MLDDGIASALCHGTSATNTRAAGGSRLRSFFRYGPEGVTRALQIIHKELDITMAFCGRTQIDDVKSDILLPGTF